MRHKKVVSDDKELLQTQTTVLLYYIYTMSPHSIFSVVVIDMANITWVGGNYIIRIPRVVYQF